MAQQQANVPVDYTKKQVVIETNKGSFTVLIGGKPVARMGDATAHGGTIMAGLPTVLIGG
jgi:uncharacterized Zn-binding protein involved in type VI secretion